MVLPEYATHSTTEYRNGSATHYKPSTLDLTKPVPLQELEMGVELEREVEVNPLTSLGADRLRPERVVA